MKTLSLHAPAKVNLALAVGAPLPDTGYHPIASWMVTLDFGDEVILKKSTSTVKLPQAGDDQQPQAGDDQQPQAGDDQQPQAGDDGPPSSPDSPSTFNIHFTPDAPKPQPVDWPLEKDLAHRAHALLERHIAGSLPVEITLNKRIPAGAGLAGGSADAAAVFVGLNQLFELGLSLQTLTELAMQLGSDIAFLVAALHHDPNTPAQTAALVTGLGETITAVPAQTLHMTLIFPPFGCPTGPVYQTFDQTLTDPNRQPDLLRVNHLIAQTPPPNDALFNDLAEPACIVQPQLAELQQQLTQLAGQPIHISGSGSTLFTLTESRDQAHALAQHITEQTQLPTRAASTLT